LNGILMAMELPGIYLRTDTDELFVFDHVEVKAVQRGAVGMIFSITNPTKFAAAVTVLAESASQAHQPLGVTSFLNWPKVEVKAGETKTVRITPEGRIL
jgi:putative salt-induced outer membrane protein YdiY